jgi:hypothetical protein
MRDNLANFFRNRALGQVIDYHTAVTGALKLVPDDGAVAKLAIDYRHR